MCLIYSLQNYQRIFFQHVLFSGQVETLEDDDNYSDDRDDRVVQKQMIVTQDEFTATSEFEK